VRVEWRKGALALILGTAPAVARAQGVNALSYRFAISLPDTGAAIRARARIFLRRLPGGDDTLRLDLVGLTVDSVWGRYRHPLRFRHADGALKIRLGPGAGSDQVNIAYHGIPQDGLIGAAFGDNWPERARYWLPTVDDPGDKATVEFAVDAPADRRVVATGRLFRVEPSARRRRVWTWSESHPVPTYVMVIGAARFTVSRHRPVIHGRDTIPIEVWAFPGDSAFADSVPFRRATEIVETMERLAGPFPYEKLAHVESSTRYGGMENATAIFYPAKAYGDRTMGEGVVRHETAHQWFGDAVTERAWAHLWLSEGFASYFDLVIGVALDGDSVLAAGMRRDAESYFASSVLDRPLVDTARQDPTRLLNANSYQKGAWVLHMLRGLVGDSAFFRGIRDYYRVYRDSTAVSADFQRVMERAAGRDLDWFFRQWLWQPGYPRLSVVWHFQPAERRVRLEVAQEQPGAWGVFRLPRLEIEAVTASGERVRRVFSMDGRTMIAFMEMDEPPTTMRVDPDARLLVTANVTP
jgi:aminopeptidase N